MDGRQPAYNPYYGNNNNPPPPYPGTVPQHNAGIVFPGSQLPSTGIVFPGSQFPPAFHQPPVYPPLPSFTAPPSFASPGYPSVPQPHVNIVPTYPNQPFPVGYPTTNYAPGYPSNPTSNQFSMLGNHPYNSCDVVGYVIEPAPVEVLKGKILLQYCASSDRYLRPTAQNSQMQGWRSLVYAEQNIFRKLEPDHHMVYLARNPGSQSARIEWRFDLGRSARRVSKLKIKFPSTIFKNGNVRVFVASDQRQQLLKQNDTGKQTVKEMEGCSRFIVVAELCGGEGAHAWQHAQLFRQPENDGCFPFEISVKMEK